MLCSMSIIIQYNSKLRVIEIMIIIILKLFNNNNKEKIIHQNILMEVHLLDFKIQIVRKKKNSMKIYVKNLT